MSIHHCTTIGEISEVAIRYMPCHNNHFMRNAIFSAQRMRFRSATLSVWAVNFLGYEDRVLSCVSLLSHAVLQLQSQMHRPARNLPNVAPVPEILTPDFSFRCTCRAAQHASNMRMLMLAVPAWSQVLSLCAASLSRCLGLQI